MQRIAFMPQCILQLYIENVCVASLWCCSSCYGRSREHKKESEAVARASVADRSWMLLRRQLALLDACLVRTSWLEPLNRAAVSGKSFAWPMSQKGSLVNSEERLANLVLVASLWVRDVHADMCHHVMCHLHMSHALHEPTMDIHKKQRLLSLGIRTIVGQASRLKRSCSKPRSVLDGRHLRPSGCNDEHFEEMFEQFKCLSDSSTLSSTGWFSPFAHQSDATSRAKTVMRAGIMLKLSETSLTS